MFFISWDFAKIIKGTSKLSLKWKIIDISLSSGSSMSAPNTACTGRGYRPKIRSAICKVSRNNISESCQSAPPVLITAPVKGLKNK